jgi:hypothetical protein
MHNEMDIDTMIGMATSLHSYIRRNPKELVYRIENPQRNCKLGGVAIGFCDHLFI